MKADVCAVAVLAFSAFAGSSVFAHHSFAMFDPERLLIQTGTVKEFEWTNPHVWLHIMAPDASGKQVEWSFEMGSVGQIAAQGWKPDLVKPGDRIAVMMHPLKDGSHGGQYVSATLPDGRSFRNVQDNGRATQNIIQ